MAQSQRIAIPGRDDLTDISATPGGTIWGTTPGGTRIAYNRDALLFMRNSPHARTPPPGMHAIAGVTVGAPPRSAVGATLDVAKPKPAAVAGKGKDDELFEMDS